MADDCTMAQMLQAPIEGYEDAIVVPHNHLRFFNKVTSTFRHPEVPNTTVKLLLFPFSLEGEARIWLDKEPPRSILTWEDLVSKFINQFFPPSKTTYLRNEITNFLQNPTRLSTKPGNVLRTYFDALDSAAGGNFLDKIPRECLSIIESKPKVRYSRSRIAAALKDKLDIRMNRFEKSLNEMKNSIVTPTAPLKAVTEQFQTAAVDNFIQYRQNQTQSLQQTINLKFFFLPSNTILNPKGEAKAITTRSGMSYKEPPIPPTGVNQQEPVEVTTDTKPQNSNDIHPPIVQAEVQVDKPADEPVV
nr:hypothetical protein [Tanacetum cinerariifolium]